MKAKVIYTSIGFVLGILVVFLYRGDASSGGKKITYLQEFEISDYSPEMILVKGSYVDSSNDLNLVSLECILTSNTCTETMVFVTEDGIIESTPTRIVARYDGLSAFHMFTIDLAMKKVVFKNESNTNSNDASVYELEDGNISLSKLQE